MAAADIQSRLQSAPIVPLIQADDTDTAVDTAKALVAGGLTVLEVVLRTDAGLACVREIGKTVPEAIVGAGTVLSGEQARSSLDAGAQFIVSPGLHESVVQVAQAADVAVFPGVATATEVLTAWNLGLRTLKFFPAERAGGIAMLKDLSSVFGDVRFMPTGGVSAANLAGYLALDPVIACGGSWLTPADAIASGDFDVITSLAEEACEIAQQVRG